MDNEIQNLYPDLKREFSNNDSYKIAFEKERMNAFRNDRNWILIQLHKYKKLRKRWKGTLSKIELLNSVLIFLSGITTVVLTTIPGVGILMIAIPIGASAIGVVSEIVGRILKGAFINGKIENMEKKIKICTRGKDELYMLHKKALEDSILTDEEVSLSKDVFDRVRLKLSEIYVSKVKKMNVYKDKINMKNDNKDNLELKINELMKLIQMNRTK